MYFIERRGSDHQWIRESSFKTEFKAWIAARHKAISAVTVYRVVHSLWPNQAVRYVDGYELVRGKKIKG